MGNVSESHEKVVVPNDGGSSSFLAESAVYRNVFAECIAVADAQKTFAAVVFQCLGTSAEDRASEHSVVLAKLRVPVHYDVRANSCSVAYDYIWPYHCVGSDNHIIAQLCFRVNYSRWMGLRTHNNLFMRRCL